MTKTYSDFQGKIGYQNLHAKQWGGTPKKNSLFFTIQVAILPKRNIKKDTHVDHAI